MGLSGSSQDPSGRSWLATRLVAWARALQRKPSPRTERIILGIAVLIFVASAIVALRALPEVRTVRWLPVVILALIGPPGLVVLNSLEYGVLASLLGYRISANDAVRVSFVSSAANMLPIPGAALVRIRALTHLGSGAGRATIAATTIGVAWLGVTGIVAGAFQLVAANTGLGAGLVGGGVVSLAGTALLVRLIGPQSRIKHPMLVILTIETLFVGLISAQFYLALQALGFDVSVSQAVAFSAPVVFSSAIGFLPGGLGLREILAAGISPLVGLPAAAGVLAASLDRLVAAVTLSILAGITLLLGGALSVRRLARRSEAGNLQEGPGPRS